jgi:hypothetical protein
MPRSRKTDKEESKKYAENQEEGEQKEKQTT